MPGKAQHLRTYPTKWVVVEWIVIVLEMMVMVVVVKFLVIVLEMRVISFAQR